MHWLSWPFMWESPPPPLQSQIGLLSICLCNPTALPLHRKEAFPCSYIGTNIQEYHPFRETHRNAREWEKVFTEETTLVCESAVLFTFFWILFLSSLCSLKGRARHFLCFADGETKVLSRCKGESLTWNLGICWAETELAQVPMLPPHPTLH